MIGTYLRNNVLGLVAIFLALSGVGYAAGLKKNSVKSKTIKDGQVLTQDIGEGAVGTGDLAANAVDGSKIKDESVTGAAVNEATLNIPSTAVDLSGFQQRVSGNCAVGESIRAIATNGTVTCQGAGGPPSGAAGGALVGTYPNPLLAADSVSSQEVVDESLRASDLDASSVGSAEVIAESLTATDLGTGSVGTSEVAADSLAAADLAPDSVGTSEIATNGVESAEVDADAIGVSEIATNGVGASEIATDAVGAPEIATDAVGAPEIATNAVGSSELGSVVVERSSATIDFNETKELVVACPAGFEAIAGGGGSNIHGVNADIRVIASVPSDGSGDALSDGDPIGAWTTVMINGGAFAETGEGYAVCLD